MRFQYSMDQRPFAVLTVHTLFQVDVSIRFYYELRLSNCEGDEMNRERGNWSHHYEKFESYLLYK